MMRALIALAVAVCLLITQSSDCWAQSAPAYNGKVNNAIGGIVEYKAGQEGFAANDNRVTGTMNAIGSSIGAFVSTVVGTAAYGFVAGTAVAWLPLLAAAAAVGVGTAAVTAGLNWIFNGDNTITPSGAAVQGASGGAVSGGTGQPGVNPTGSTGTAAYPDSPDRAWDYPGQPQLYSIQWGISPTNYVVSDRPSTAVLGYMQVRDGTVPGWSFKDIVRVECIDVYPWQCYVGKGAVDSQYNDLYFNPGEFRAKGDYASGQTLNYNCSNGFIVFSLSSGGSILSPPVCYPRPALASAPVTTLSLSSAVNSVPSSVLAQPVDPSLLASTINQQWESAASQPGYQGLPFQASNPVTSADVSAWQAANPNAYPTVGDALAPVSQGNTVGNPEPVKIPDPSQGGAPSNNQGTNPGTGNQLNLGPDPGIGSPGLEATPTAQQIIAPLSGALPGLKGFTLPAHSSACPTGNFVAFGKSFTVDAHCTILSNNSSAIQAGFLVFWTVAALFIILAA